MFKPTRIQHRSKAFTIIESLVVLIILLVLSMVVIALYLHGKETDRPTGPASAAPISAPADPSPASAAGDETE